MPKYRVFYTETVTGFYDLEALTPEDAEVEAEDMRVEAVEGLNEVAERFIQLSIWPGA